MNLRFDTVATVQQFQYLMYRPLYWFGDGGSDRLDPSLSLAMPPRYSAGGGGTTVTVTLRHDEWSDGKPVTSANVMFWMNMLHAEKANWAGYQPGGDGMPDDLASVTVDGPHRITFQVDGAVDPTWFTDSQLSQITPLPVAWDRPSTGQAAGTGGCSAGLYGTVDNQCATVYKFLSAQAGFDPSQPTGVNRALGSYATNPLWQVVDGPWRLGSFGDSGDVTFDRNPRYSGPASPGVERFEERPFATDSSEIDALAGGAVNVGYLPLEDAPTTTGPPGEAGPNPGNLGGDTLAPVYPWGVDFAPYNFRSTSDSGVAGAIFSQGYVRQAMQSLVDQPALIATVDHGYAVPTYGPIPTIPGSRPTPATVTANPYPYDPAHAVSLLTSHGWHVVTGKASTCVSPGDGPGQCGADIPAGARLAFTVDYVNGGNVGPSLDAERADWSRAGIDVSLVPEPAATVLAGTTPCPSGCPWAMSDWGGGWLYAPSRYPSGEDVFTTGSDGNAGTFSDPSVDADVTSILSGAGTATSALSRYAGEVAQQLPVLFQPTVPLALTEIEHGLEGVTPQNVFGQITPERWHWSS
jgi:peptide/nickel transport system substrate-binding protein